MDNIKQMAKAVAKCIKGDTKKTKAYDTAATVRRIEGNTAYVEIPGGTGTTPVKKTIDARVGDTVQVHVGGGTAWLVGNRTAPPTDDTIANAAHKRAVVAEVKAVEAEQTANAVEGIATSAKAQAAAAKQIADDTEQHFWFTETGADTGAHITEVTQEEWNDPSDPNYQSGGNLLARSNGIAVREGMKELATMSQAGFGAKTYDSGGNEVTIAHLGYGEANGEGVVDNAPYYTLGTRKTTGFSAYNAGTTYIQGDIVSYNGGNYLCIISCTNKLPTNTSYWSPTINGDRSLVTGNDNIATGRGSLSIGKDNITEGSGSISAGYHSKVYGDNSLAIGYHCNSLGSPSYTMGIYLNALHHVSQTVIGKYNDNKSTDLFEIGNGTADDARSNAFEVSSTGDVTVSGDISTAGDISADGSLALDGSTMADFITSKGSSGSWYYEKYKSGKVEAWGTATTGTLTMSGSNRVYVAQNVSITNAIPSGIFSSTPTFTEVSTNYASAACYSVSGNATSNRNVSLQIVKTSNATAAVTVQLHCVYYPSSY